MRASPPPPPPALPLTHSLPRTHVRTVLTTPSPMHSSTHTQIFWSYDISSQGDLHKFYRKCFLGTASVIVRMKCSNVLTDRRDRVSWRRSQPHPPPPHDVSPRCQAARTSNDARNIVKRVNSIVKWKSSGLLISNFRCKTINHLHQENILLIIVENMG